MSPARAAPPCGAVSRADLLRALAVAPRLQLALDHDAESWFGYVLAPEPAPPAPRIETSLPALGSAGPSPSGETRLPLRLAFQHVIAERQQRQKPEETESAAAAAAPAAPIDEEAAKAPSPVRLIDYEDLVPQARLIPALRRQLSATRSGALDVDRLTRQLASNELPRFLPRRRLRRWHPDLVVVLDFCPRLWPYREDMHRLAERLLRFCGRAGVALRIINHGPWGTWSDWVDHQNPRLAGLPAERPWSMPAAGTPVLLASDLGLLLGAQSPACRAWIGFINSLRSAHVKPLALVPLGAGQLSAEVAQALPVLRWSPDAAPHPTRAHGPARARPEGLDDLLALVAAVRRVDPPLLRALRRLNGRAPLDAGLEGALWCHPDVEAGCSASLSTRPGIADPHLTRFARLLPTLQARLNELRTLHHAHLRAVINHEEALLWAAHAAEAAWAESPEIRRSIDQADRFMRGLAATLTQPGSAISSEQWWSVAQDIVVRADASMGRKYAALLTPLVAARLRRQWASGKKDPEVPDWTDPAHLAAALDDRHGPLQAWLVRDAASASVVLQAQPAGPRQSAMGEPLRLDAGGAKVQRFAGASTAVFWLPATQLPARLLGLNERNLLQIETSSEILTIAAIPRPRGAAGWGCDGNGLTVRSAPLAGYEAQWGEPALRITAVPGGPRPWLLEAEAVGPAQGGAQWLSGIDAPHGVYAEFTLKTRHGRANQRLRWIEPGSFLMGSPEDEPERATNEGPQHLVTLSEGFWLADTACTQALWQAVMGNNPSHFKDDPQRPVEEVSWRDAQDFLRKLETLLPGNAAALPTEAQWEYACRAGTNTPFSFGPQITPEQVNYYGDYPYAGGAKGENRGQTVPVKSLPANPWGLYEMHGNVWEWCADGWRTYEAGSERDPLGSLDPADQEAQRCVRGGSWNNNARGSRSANRGPIRPGERYDIVGFRFCLRSIEPGQDRVLPGGLTGRKAVGAPGGRAAALMRRARRWIDDLRPDRKGKA